MMYYYINLDRVPERASFMERQFETLGLQSQLHRVSATDALTMPPQAGYQPRQWGPRWEMTKSEIACFSSHRRCWEMAAEQTDEYAVILEDDVIMSSELESAIKDIISFSPKNLDVIKLDGVPQIRRYGPASPLSQTRQLREILQTVHSAGCYMITRHGAMQLLSNSTSFCDHLDDYIFNPAPGRRIMQLEPAIAVQAILSKQSAIETVDNKVMTSERTHDPQINAKISKGPLPYRAMKEIKRSATKLSRKIYGDRVLKAYGGLIGAPRLAHDLGDYVNKPDAKGEAA